MRGSKGLSREEPARRTNAGGQDRPVPDQTEDKRDGNLADFIMQ